MLQISGDFDLGEKPLAAEHGGQLGCSSCLELRWQAEVGDRCMFYGQRAWAGGLSLPTPGLRLSEVPFQVVQAGPMLIGEDQSVSRSVN